MKRLLFINACVRAESRTRRLAEELLSGWQGEIRELNLEQMDLRPLTAETLARRDALLAAGDYADPAFEPARALVEADAVVLAAPYWDCSFPASVKVFVEQVMVNGLTFTFTADGVPHGKCRAKKLWYVSTAGGPDENFIHCILFYKFSNRCLRSCICHDHLLSHKQVYGE